MCAWTVFPCAQCSSLFFWRWLEGAALPPVHALAVLVSKHGLEIFLGLGGKGAQNPIPEFPLEAQEPAQLMLSKHCLQTWFVLPMGPCPWFVFCTLCLGMKQGHCHRRAMCERGALPASAILLEWLWEGF